MAVKKYRTVQGDTFDGIAWRIWGQEHMAHILMEANPAHMDVLLFGPGIELTVPDARPETTVPDLPPWYAGGQA